MHWAAYAAEPASAFAPQTVRELRGAEKSLQRGTPLPPWVDTSVVAPAASKESPLVIRLSDMQVYVDKEPVVYAHRVLQANDASMLAVLGKIEISFQPEYQQVSLHSLRVIRGGASMDKTGTAEIRFLQREQALDEGIYTGSVTASIVIDDIRVGDTLDISYSISGNNPVFGGKFFQSFSWDGGFPTQRKRITLNAPENRSIYYRISGPGNAIVPKEQKSGNRKITSFSADNLAAIDFEPYAPTDVEQFRQIQFSEFRNWQQVAQWAESLFKVEAPAVRVEEATASMLGNANTDDTVQRALGYVQENIRYLSISLGENSHKPFPPDLVLSRRYGDCKDKALLLVTMLRQLGIEADPVLVSTYSHKGLEQMLPTPLAFDHAIVRTVVNNKVYFIDPTRSVQYGPLDNMGQVHAGAQVLVIRGDTDRLSIVPAAAVDTILSNTRIDKVTLSKVDGPAVVAVTNRYTGLEAENVRYYVTRQTREQLRKAYTASIIRLHPNAEILSDPKVDDNRQTNILKIETRFRIPGFLEKNDTGWQLRYQASNLRERFYLPENPRRVFPLMIPGESQVNRYEIELNLPEDFNAGYQPSEQILRNAGFNAKENLSFTGHTVRASVELNVLADRVPAAEVPDFMADVRKLGAFVENSLQIRKSDVKEGNLRPLLDAPIKQRLSEQQEGLISNNSRAIADARSAGATTAEALCARGLGYAHVGRKTEALADIQTALKEKPGSNELIRCRAEIEFFNGDMKSSEADFNQAISLGISDGKSYFQRAMASYVLGKSREAAEGYALAFERLTDPKEKARAEIMRSISLHRINPRNHTSSQISDQDEWPGIVLAAVEHTRSDEEVLRQIHRRTGDELDIALSDGYYYLAQLNLLNGNKLKATVYLQRSVDKGVLSNAYRPAARVEMERLRK
ncbi:hypothetical protein GCM10011396_11570 [Undibacterium terreum]|uniref:Transglutaminase-like domain-containing protein n=1 Tax=Undibacterium terreum TaxID=1224302 RepID=A0A916XEL2_9BURK|nr:hypothetical protein GCM10011396_11570 [Undibacterium terreum]